MEERERTGGSGNLGTLLPHGLRAGILEILALPLDESVQVVDHVQRVLVRVDDAILHFLQQQCEPTKSPLARLTDVTNFTNP
jgi:hypothetical protein